MELLGVSFSVEAAVFVIVFLVVALAVLVKRRGVGKREATGDGAGSWGDDGGDCSGD